MHPEWVGTRLVGGDNQRCWKGKPLPPSAKAGSGFRCRSKAPVRDDAGRVVGIVSVGYLTSYLDSITLQKVINIFVAACCCWLRCYFLLVLHPQHQEADLLPRAREIGLLVRQQKAMMESIYEGVIVIDHTRRIKGH
ncbi:Sensor histidine kinase DpiB [Raoultella terrigena]|uniref:Sensor histidine kinase DpiB n=1 Tax=Raoultella terrigena TaxID=577 RepID=A0A4U9DD56_RAOTE|nr:Sensor histidine kinase DpiB [Raoultella terrigena]